MGEETAISQKAIEGKRKAKNQYKSLHWRMEVVTKQEMQTSHDSKVET